MADQFTGRNLAITAGAVTVPCPQSFEVSSQHEFVEYYCVGASGKQRIYDGTDWSASCTFFPEDTDYADLAALNSSTAVSCTVYPDGNTSGKIKITFSAFPSVSLSVQRGSAASATATFVVDGAVTITSATGS